MPESPVPQPSPAAPPAGRIAQRFRELAASRELGLVVYVTAGDPSLDATRDIVEAAAKAGADVIELGVPFSDPLADGPAIQRASERALRAGTTLAGVIGLAARLRERTQVPLILFSYFNPILQMGLDKFAADAATAGVDGALATDLNPDEAEDYRTALRARGLDTIFLAAPTSTDARLERIAKSSSGFVYLVSRMGVTGAREALPEELPALAAHVRRFTPLPLAVGFGISQPAHMARIGAIADAAVVGSAVVQEIERAPTAAEAAANVARLVQALKGAARKSARRI